MLIIYVGRQRPAGEEAGTSTKETALDTTRPTNEVFVALLRATTDGVLLTDSTRDVVLANDAFCDLFHARWRDVVGSSLDRWLERLEGDAVSRWRELENTLRVQDQVRNARFCKRGRHTAPRALAVNAALLPAEGDEGQCGGVIVSLWRDVTPYRTLQEQHSRLAAAIELLDESVIITDPDGMIQCVNAAFERASGYSRDEMVGQNPRILKSGLHEDAFYEDMWYCITQGGVWSGTLINRTKGGQLYRQDTVIYPIKDAGGRITNFVAVKDRVQAGNQTTHGFRGGIRSSAGIPSHRVSGLLDDIVASSDELLDNLSAEDVLFRHVMALRTAARRAAELTGQQAE